MGIRTRVGQANGRRRFNAPEDVVTIKVLLNMLYPRAGLPENPIVSERFLEFIEFFQRERVGMVRA